MNISQYKFIDLGCSNGGSLDYFQRMLNGKGLGIDIDANKVAATKAAGFDAVECDITELELASKVDIITMNHFLEHIPSVDLVDKIINSSITHVRDYVFIRQPFFDADPYLFSKGLKMFWSDWTGHPNNMTTLEFHNILKPLVTANKIKAFKIYGKGSIRSSADTSVVPISTIKDSHQYQPNFGHKPIFQFNTPVYKEIIVIIEVNSIKSKFISSEISQSVLLFDSTINK